ncbi:MAG: mechanosensitive ion channel domain-containing protein [Gammaproteobacteria bacterium]
MQSNHPGVRPPLRPRSVLVLLTALIGAALLFTVATPVQANDAHAEMLLNQSLSAKERKDLLARLSDQQVRDVIWDLIETSSSPTDREAAGIAKEVDDISARLRENAQQLAVHSSQLVMIPSIVINAMTPAGRKPAAVIVVVLAILTMIAVGWLGQRLLKNRTRPIYDTLTQGEGENFPQRLTRRFLIFLYDLLSPAVFAAITYLAFQIGYQGHEPNRLLALGVISGIVTAMVLVQVVKLVFSPNRPRDRLTPLNDEDSRKLSNSLSAILIVGTAMFYFSGYLGDILPRDRASAAIGLINLVSAITLMLLIIALMWRVKTPVSLLIQSGKRPGVARRLFANIWPAVGNAIVLLLLAVGIVSALGLDQKGVFNDVLETLLLLIIVAPLALGLVGPLIREWGHTKHSLPSSDQRDGVVKLARIVILAITLFILGNIWDVNIITLTRSKLGETISQAGLQIVITIILANLAWSAVKRWIDSKQEQSSGGEGHGHSEAGGDPGGQGLSRIGTILPLLRGTLLAVITTVAIMISLSSLGVDTAPLIAAASVFGLAIGFGAQTLVSDIISGIFFLVDDAFRKGEYIDVGGNTGTVEKISVRSMRLRHHNGPVHTIPYNRISTLTNFSRDWVIMKFELRIPFEENVEKVRKLIKKVGQKLLEDPEHGPEFLEPLKSQGVNRMDDSAFVVRCKFSTKPGKQWAIRRIAYAAIQDAFAEAGIKFAPKRVVVETVTSGAAAAGAAAQLSQDQ